MNPNFTSEENEILKILLSQFVIKKRSGEIGIMHGADRFITTNLSIKKSEKVILNSAFKKLGIHSTPKEI